MGEKIYKVKFKTKTGFREITAIKSIPIIKDDREICLYLEVEDGHITHRYRTFDPSQLISEIEDGTTL